LEPTLGTLYIVATPIGNPDDISARALRVLAEADWIVCEEIAEGERLLKRLPGHLAQDGVTALVLAIINAHYDAATLLLDLGANPNVADARGMAALYAAVDMNTLDETPGRPDPKITGSLDSLAMIESARSARKQTTSSDPDSHFSIICGISPRASTPYSSAV
jgi:hypothetical protein